MSKFVVYEQQKISDFDKQLKSNQSKRKRVPISCYACRLRKIKCDRNKPFCKSCISKKITHLCKYEEELWAKESPEAIAKEKLLEEIDRLRRQIKQLHLFDLSPSKECPDISLRTPEATTNTSSHSVSVDLSFDDTKKFLTLAVKNLNVRFFGVTSYMFIMLNDDITREAFSFYLEHQVLMWNKIKDAESTSKDVEILTSDTSDNLGPQLVNKHRAPKLPNRRVITLLIQRFFQFCHHLIPFLDAENVYQDVNYVFLRQADFETFAAKYPAHSAILLLVLRVAYLSLPLKAYYEQKLSDDTFALVNEIVSQDVVISLTFVDYASSIILSVNFFRRTSMRTLQAALTLYVYKLHSPEDDENSADLSVLFGVVLQMARLLGLHELRNELTDNLHDATEKMQRRIIWSYIMYYDSKHAFRMGTKLLITENEFAEFADIASFKKASIGKTPFQEPICLLEYMDLKNELTRILRKAVSITTGFNDSSIPGLNLVLRDLQYMLDVSLANFETQYITKFQDSLTNVGQRIQLYALRAELNFNMYILYNALFLLCKDNSEEVSALYYRRALIKALEVLIVGYEFAVGKSEFFCAEYEVLYAVSLWTPMQKALPLLASTLVRILRGEFSFSKCFDSFSSSEKNLILQWGILSTSDDRLFVRDLYRILKVLFEESKRLCASFLQCFKASLILKTIIDYFDKSSQQTGDFFLPLSKEDEIDIGISGGEVDLCQLLNDFFESQNHESVFDADFFLSSLHSDFSPFFGVNSSAFEGT